MLVIELGFIVEDVDDDKAVVGGVDANEGFTVFGMPHTFDSVVLTTLRLGLLGSHIFALSSDDRVLVTPDDEDICCA